MKKTDDLMRLAELLCAHIDACEENGLKAELLLRLMGVLEKLREEE